MVQHCIEVGLGQQQSLLRQRHWLIRRLGVLIDILQVGKQILVE